MGNSFNVFIDALTCGGTDVPVYALIDVLRGCGRDFRGRNVSSFTELEINFGGGIGVPIRAPFVSRVSREHRITKAGSVFGILFPTLAYKHSY
jgi:hypothetical protein